MVLKLYGSSVSTCTHRVAIVLHEKQVPFELHPIDLAKREHKTPEFLARQPFGQVPYIDDDGFILYECRAISHYIATKYAGQGTPLIPFEPHENALFHQAVSVEVMNFNEYAHNAVFEIIVKPRYGETPDKEVFNKYIETLSAKLDVYDRILSKQKYVAGNEITLADLYHIPYGSILSQAGSNIMETRPNVNRWFTEICSRPSWQAVKDGIKSTA